jgi:ketosteroid isomerase-like protein
MDKTIVFKTPEDAEQAFYNAFERADIDSMMSIWAPSEGIVCIHPLGPRIFGTAAVRASWERIFASEAHIAFTLIESQNTQDSRLAVHVHKEKIEVDEALQGVMLATNIYQLINGSWRLILHHASPEPRLKQAKTESHVVH